MGPLQDPTSMPGTHESNVQGLPLHRRFGCAKCSRIVILCSPCDRGNIYCPECAPLAEQERLARARQVYRRTERGREMRKLSHRRRRARRRWEIVGAREGDRGSLATAGESNNSAGQSSPPEDLPPHADDDVPDFRVEQEGGAASPALGAVVCAACLGPCAASQRQTYGWRWRVQKRAVEPRARVPFPRGPPDGGGIA